jgi:hypothetical protein
VRHEFQFEQADAAVARAVATFVGTIDWMMARWEAVMAQYVLERVLLHLCDELTKRIDYFSHPGDATLKLSNALHDCWNSRWEERG